MQRLRPRTPRPWQAVIAAWDPKSEMLSIGDFRHPEPKAFRHGDFRFRREAERTPCWRSLHLKCRVLLHFGFGARDLEIGFRV